MVKWGSPECSECSDTLPEGSHWFIGIQKINSHWMTVLTEFCCGEFKFIWEAWLRPLSLCFRISKFPNTLNVDDTRKAISIAFTKWSDVSPLTFTEVTEGNASADITIGTRSNQKTDTGRNRWEKSGSGSGISDSRTNRTSRTSKNSKTSRTSSLFYSYLDKKVLVGQNLNFRAKSKSWISSEIWSLKRIFERILTKSKQH